MGRKDIQNQHEESVIQEFMHWYAKYAQESFDIIERPDPPDAIVKSEKRFCWIEHGDIYRHPDDAREERSFANHEEDRFLHSEQVFINPDQDLFDAFVRVLNKKLSNTAYEKAVQSYGQGILLLTERYPLFGDDDLKRIQEYCLEADFLFNLGYFESVYLGVRTERLIFVQLCST
jgi:hypothetical protein